MFSEVRSVRLGFWPVILATKEKTPEILSQGRDVLKRHSAYCYLLGMFAPLMPFSALLPLKMVEKVRALMKLIKDYRVTGKTTFLKRSQRVILVNVSNPVHP